MLFPARIFIYHAEYLYRAPQVDLSPKNDIDVPSTGLFYIEVNKKRG